MSNAELKEVIQKAIEDIPENAPENILQEVLGYINDVNIRIAEKGKRAGYVKEIIAEDKQVFEKLAQ